MVCKHCGQEIEEGLVVCSECGKHLDEGETPTEMMVIETETEDVIEEKVPLSSKLISFIIPIVGIILYFVKRNEHQKEAKACLKWAIISVVVILVFSAIFGGLVMFAAYTAAKNNPTIQIDENNIDFVFDGATDESELDEDLSATEIDDDFEVPPIV